MDAVRETWTLDIDPDTHRCERCKSNRTVKYLFLLGEEAADEAPELDVAVLRRCNSDYEHLAHKVRQGIRYAVTHYSFHVLLKADTDSWIFLDRLIDFAESHRLFARSAVHAGEIRRHGKPQTYKGAQNRDEVFSQLTSQDTYPVYTPGCGYLLTRDLCNYISLLSEDHHRRAKDRGGEDAALPGLMELPQEDVAVGFWLEAVDHQRLSMPLSIFGDACRRSDGESLVLDHYVSQDQMHRRWHNLQQSGDPCHGEAGAF
ncbi:GALT6 [Symbiodinium natans]|uniref:Hexosyltransferase n=1 Tax=Symbiodinium natans TaxID=878477 RepID=A0A812KCY2_9DINO|nr:GALT6 [Symbiodinium natans]